MRVLSTLNTQHIGDVHHTAIRYNPHTHPQVDEVRDRLALDWRRYLALHLWYNAPAVASPAAAVSMYQVWGTMQHL